MIPYYYQVSIVLCVGVVYAQDVLGLTLKDIPGRERRTSVSAVARRMKSPIRRDIKAY